MAFLFALAVVGSVLAELRVHNANGYDVSNETRLYMMRHKGGKADFASGTSSESNLSRSMCRGVYIVTNRRPLLSDGGWVASNPLIPFYPIITALSRSASLLAYYLTKNHAVTVDKFRPARARIKGERIPAETSQFSKQPRSPGELK